MKITQYFKTVQELNDYYPNGVPSTVLAIVEEKNVLYTSSNNEFIGGGPVENQGGYIDSPETVAEIGTATVKTETILGQ